MVEQPLILCSSCGQLKTTADFHKKTKSCKPCVSQTSKEKRLQLRNRALAIYGGKCACCGITECVFLAIDHINNDGARHREQIGRSSDALHRDLEKRGWPPHYQVLCHNCNHAKIYGECPHKVLLKKAA